MFNLSIIFVYLLSIVYYFVHFYLRPADNISYHVGLSVGRSVGLSTIFLSQISHYDDDEEDDDEVEDNDKDNDNNDKDISALGLDRDMGFSRGHQGRQGHRPHDDDDDEEEDNEVEDNKNYQTKLHATS